MIFRKGEQLTARKLNEIQPDTLDRIRAGKGVRIHRDLSGVTISTDERFRSGFNLGESSTLIKVVQIKSTPASIYSILLQCVDVETGTDIQVMRPLEIMRRYGRATYVRGSAETQLVRWSAGPSMDRRIQTWTSSDSAQTEKQVVVPPYYTGEYLMTTFCIFPRAVLSEFGIELPATDTHAGYWMDINTMGRSWAREDGQYL